MMEQEDVVIGKVLGAKGIKGELKVLPLTHSIDRFRELKRVFVFVNGERKGFSIEYVRPYKNIVLLKFEEIPDRTAAEKLKGKELKIPKTESPPPPEDHYYYYQIVGLQVFTEEGGYLGRVVEILETGANDVYVVQGDREYLIPAVEKFVKEIDLTKERIIIRPVEGLLEL